jgi:hypothetical protein
LLVQGVSFRFAETAAPESVAVTAAVTEEVTDLCPIRKATEVFPAAIVTETGTVAELVELFNRMTTPPTGAGPVIVAVPVTTVVELPLTVAGVTASPRIDGALMVSVAELELLPSEAVSFTAVTVFTGLVATTNLAELEFGRMVTEAGTVADFTEAVRTTRTPPDAEEGVALRVTRPAHFAPPIKLTGLTVIEETPKGIT